MLVVFEGLQNCGKSTYLNNLQKWIRHNINDITVTTSWNSYPGLEEFNTKLKKEDLLTSLTGSLIHALDFNLRYYHIIKPCLDKGGIVLADRYTYTAYIRDSLREVSTVLLDEMYQHVQEPDLVFFIDIDPKVSVDRIKTRPLGRSNYILGLDLNLSSDITKNYYRYLELQRRKYLSIAEEKKDIFFVINGSQDKKMQFNNIINIFKDKYYELNSKNI